LSAEVRKSQASGGFRVGEKDIRCRSGKAQRQLSIFKRGQQKGSRREKPKEVTIKISPLHRKGKGSAPARRPGGKHREDTARTFSGEGGGRGECMPQGKNGREKKELSGETEKVQDRGESCSRPTGRHLEKRCPGEKEARKVSGGGGGVGGGGGGNTNFHLGTR